MSSSLTGCANVRAAAMNISSVTSRVPLAIAPSPTPGKMYELFPWRRVTGSIKPSDHPNDLREHHQEEHVPLARFLP